MPVVGLGHTGLWVDDLEKMRDFYERVIGLTVTDEDHEQGIVFFSAQPDVEHHEFVLQRGRPCPPSGRALLPGGTAPCTPALRLRLAPSTPPAVTVRMRTYP